MHALHYNNYQFRNEANYNLLAVRFDLYQEARNYITKILTISLAPDKLMMSDPP